AAPENLQCTPISTSEIDLAWSDQSANEKGFKIYRNGGSLAGEVLLVTVGKNEDGALVTGLAAGETYQFSVYAYNDAADRKPVLPGPLRRFPRLRRPLVCRVPQ
ncbi:MAG: fibronectin type III domain-containing protein, partial [bacterium]